MKILFISDFFANQLPGGAEMNDDVLLTHLEGEGFDINRSNSSTCKPEQISSVDFIVVSNFIGLPKETREALIKDGRYMIYEHDHKYVSTRDPSKFENFKTPPNHVVNERLYNHARLIVVLGEAQGQTLKAALQNYGSKVHSIGCSLWPKKTFSLMRQLVKDQDDKEDISAIVDSKNPIKKTQAAVDLAKKHDMKYELIKEPNHTDFLKKLAEFKGLIFLPGVLESLSRLYVEARMLGLNVITTPKLLGASYEPWHEHKGLELIDIIEGKNLEALDFFSTWLKKQKGSKAGILKSDFPDFPYKNVEKKNIAFIGKFRELYDEEGKALAIEKCGYNIIRYDEDSFNRNSINNIDTLFSTNLEAIFFTKLRVPAAKSVVEIAKEKGIKTVCWVPDLYFGVDRIDSPLHRSPIFQADFVLTPDGGNDESFLRRKINHFLVRQAIANDAIEFTEEEKRIDILFVGSLEPRIHGSDRANLINFLQTTYGDRFFWAGKTSPRAFRGHDLTRLIAASKIVIGDSVDSKSYWSNRVYECLGRKGFMLHTDIEDFDKEFTPGVHLDTFKRGDFKDLAEKIDYYLNQTEIRKQIAIAGHNHVREKHTLDHRAQNVLKIIGEKK